MMAWLEQLFNNDLIFSLIQAAIVYVLGFASAKWLKCIREYLFINRKKNKRRDILRENYLRPGFCPIISYGDSRAIKVFPKMREENVVIEADIDLSELPTNNINRNFVMVVLKYIPETDFSVYFEHDYCFSFEFWASENIGGIQLEIKYKDGSKVIDQFIKNDAANYKHKIVLKKYGNKEAWKHIFEMCFTLFCEDKYIVGHSGKFEIREFVLHRERNA